MDHRLTEMLVCPLCKGPLQLRRDEATRPVELLCPADRLGYPIRDGIPVMLESEARHIDSSSPQGPLGSGPSSAPEEQA